MHDFTGSMVDSIISGQTLSSNLATVITRLMNITKYFASPFNATLVLSAALSAVPGIALASGTIQGEKIDDQGNLFTRPSTISIRNDSRTWYGPSFGSSVNPFVFKDLPPGTYEVGVQVPDGYRASYSICTNCIAHPDSSYVAFQVPAPYAKHAAGYAPALMTVPDGGFADLWWKFTETNEPQDQVFDKNTLNQTLICNFEWLGIPATTNTQSISGSDVRVNVGIAGGFGGVGTVLSLQDLSAPNSAPLNIIEGKSAAGSGWQTAFYDGDRPNNLIVIPNQAVGNSDLQQWGYAGTYSGLQQLDWNPLFSDHYSNTNWAKNIGTTPCYNTAFRYADGQSSIQGSVLPTSVGNVVRLINTYTLRSRIAKNWSFWVADQAIYMYRDLAQQHTVRLYLAKADGSHIEGPITPYNDFDFTSSTADYSNCPAGHNCSLQENNVGYAILIWNVAGRDIGIAIHRTDNKPFNGNMVLERTPLCLDPNNYSCGNMSFHATFDSNFDSTINPAFVVGDIRSYALAYDVGTLDQLAALGYTTAILPHPATRE